MNAHILVVDDNLKNLQIVGKILRDNGYSISVAQSGQSALEIIYNHVPDVLLLDIMMPEMSGFELCRELKSNESLKEIPVIFLTAKNQTEDLVEGFRSGGVDYLTKPFNADELLIRLKTHIDLAMSKKKIIELNRTRDKLYSIVTHDLRSPLNSILMSTELMASGTLDFQSREFKEFIGLLHKEVQSTASLLNNLLQWTRAQNGTIPLNKQKQQIKPLIQDCVNLFAPMADQKSILLEADVPEKLYAVFDENSIHTVIRNILSNAIKFTRENGKIVLSAAQNESYATISIQDDGVGMTPEIIDRIMVKNESYTSFGTKRETGSGLGLFIVKDFIEKNDGKLEAKSIPGQGTTFMISLPGVS